MRNETRQQLRAANYRPVRVLVETYIGPVNPDVLDNIDPESRKFIDHANSSDRKWLGTHCFWAMRNNRTVISTPIGNSTD